MGWIRGFFTVIVGVLLFFSLFAVNLFGILSLSLTYENVYNESSVIFEDILQDLNVSSIIEERYPVIVSFCQNNSEFVFSEADYVFEIPCESVLQGTEAVIDEGVKSVVRKIYYEDYSGNASSYLDESQSAPLFLISQNAQKISNKVFYYSILASLILIILLFVIVEKKSNAFLIPGIYLVSNSLVFFKIKDIFSLYSEGIVFQFLGIFFSTAFPVSIRLLIAGILLILVAVFFKAFRVGFWISSLVEKFKGMRQEVKPKIKKK